MRRVVVLLAAAAAVTSGCGGDEEGKRSGGAGSGVAVARCDPAGRDGTRAYMLCLDDSRVDRRFVVDDGGEIRPLDVRSPGIAGVGHWSWAALSPDGSTFLAQWIAECEVPVAYFVPAAGGRPRPVVGAGVESIALGWSSDGAAEVALPKGVCGASGGRPGVYAVGLDGQRRFLRALDPSRDRIRT